MRMFVRMSSTALTMVVLAGAFATASAQAPIVMAQGLDNPRGLAFGPDGALYVVEAGRGGCERAVPAYAEGGARGATARLAR